MRAKNALRVWLDDQPERDPSDSAGWVVVRTPQDAITLLQHGTVVELSLDYDLGLFDDGGREHTGDDVLKWILEAVVTRCFKPPPEIWVHSANPAGRRRMELGIEAIYRTFEENCPRPVSKHEGRRPRTS